MAKILHTESSCGWGGQEIRILTEISGMRSHGHDMHLACVPNSRIHQVAKNKYAITCHPLPIEKKSLRGIASIGRLLKSEKFDLVNTHSSTDTWLAALAMRLHRVKLPLIRTRHVSSEVPNNYLSRWLYTKATDHIITTGEKLRLKLINQFNLPPDNVTSIPTGIDLEKFHPAKDKSVVQAKLGISSEKLNLLIVATLRSWKGHEYLLRACAELRGEFDFHLYIVGDGPQRDNLEKQIIALELQNHVTMTGHIEEPVEWLQSADIFILPSYANEGVPQSLMQAMACALPVISTNVGSVTELIDSGVDGMIIESKSLSSINKAIKFLSKKPKIRDSLSKQAIIKVKSEFHIELMIVKTEKVISKLLKDIPIIH